jgi:phenylalanyl-tRNA synthetase alpha chain
MTDFQAVQQNLTQRMAGASSLKELEEERVAAFGKQGEITQLLKSIKALSSTEKKLSGPAIHALKSEVERSYAARKTELEAANLSERLSNEKLDVTLPVRRSKGSVHVISQTLDEVVAIFSDLGFGLAEGPDVEEQFYNFTALNFPHDHPAREMHDTFFFQGQSGKEPKVLRTHTSPVQIRTMLSNRPPIRVIMPGRTYRNDSDQTHTPMFHQLEGLVVEQGAHMGHLKWLLHTFLTTYFENDAIEIRMRPSFFPFTSPSMEVDINYGVRGNEIVLGEGDKWMEIIGCGMVHPNVLKNCNLDPDEHQGFAWGLGLDRIAMLKHGITDLRGFFGADVRWLEHYGFDPLDIPSLAGGLSNR